MENQQNSYSVEVPASIYGEVLAFMAEALAGSNAAPSSGELVSVDGNGSWSEADIIELRARMKNPLGRAVINCIAEASTAGVDVTYEELRAAGDALDAKDFTYDNLRSQLSWFSKYSKAIKAAKVWPMRITDRGKDFPKGERYTYRMPAAIAAWWLNAEGAE